METIKLDPFTRLLSINFGSVMWLSVHAHGQSDFPGPGLEKRGSFITGVVLNAGVAAHSTTENIFQTNPYPVAGQSYEQWTLCKFGPPAPPPAYTGDWVRINQGGEWAIRDVPGLPVFSINPGITEIYLYGPNNKRDPSNQQSGLQDATGLTAQPLAHLLLPNEGRVTSPGEVKFMGVLVRITQDKNFQVTFLPP